MMRKLKFELCVSVRGCELFRETLANCGSIRAGRRRCMLI
jgi:hypothetical protein